MIDIIIPAYNAHKTIIKTLFSIEIQTMVDNINVYIVDDASEKDYEYLKDIFKSTLRINIIRNSKNLGPGGTRQKALEKSNSEYIVFIDADDVLYDIYAIENLYKNMENYDGVWGTVLEQKEVDQFTFEVAKDLYLHGKMFRRSIIEKNEIRFCNSKIHEDDVFNALYKTYCESINIIDDIVYVYTRNESSIIHTANDIEIIKSLIEVFKWMLNEELKRNLDKEIIAVHVYVMILNIYNNYFSYKNIEKLDFVFKEMESIKKVYMEYNILDDYTKKNIYEKLKIGVIQNMSVDSFLNCIYPKKEA